MNRYQEQVDERTVTAMKVLKIFGFAILGSGLAVLLGFVVMWLWNALMPDIFGLGEIGYWQGVGLFILGRILFGGFGSGSSGSSEKTPKGVIGSEIRNEVRKEMQKELEMESGESRFASDTGSSNEDHEALYDKWWDSEGEKLFESYMNARKEKS